MFQYPRDSIRVDVIVDDRVHFVDLPLFTEVRHYLFIALECHLVVMPVYNDMF